MISGILRSFVFKRLPFFASTVLFFLVTGCDPEGYPSELQYPARTDLIFAPQTIPEDEVPYPEPPGHLEEGIHKFADILKEKSIGGAYDPAEIPSQTRSQISDAVTKCFGTPAQPSVTLASKGVFEEDQVAAFDEALKTLKLDGPSLAAGSVLFRRHCLQCHGVSGNGRGPTGPWLHPHPRDYRKARFKYTSTGNDARGMPSRHDLKRIISQGIDTTSMPSFGLLSESEIDHLISYVIHLSLRGKAEEETMIKVHPKSGQELEDNNAFNEVQRQLVITARFWASKTVEGIDENEKSTPKYWPTKSPSFLDDLGSEDGKKAISSGYEIFVSQKALCTKCHKDFGRQANFRYDVWGTLVQPRNLTAGIYRGGRRPIDLYWRIKGGINPVAMPEASLNQDEMWNLIAFLRALPYPNMLPDDVRKQIYPIQLAKKEE